MHNKRQSNTWYRLMAGLYLTFESVYPADSQPMTSHLRKVKDGFKRVIEHPELHPRTPQDKPVVSYLKNTLKMGAYFNESPIYKTLGFMGHQLTWEYGYHDLPEDLADRYAYAEVVGPRGPVVCDSLIAGMVLLGPSCHYPSHRHPGIEASYVCLAGSVAINDTMVLTTNAFGYFAPSQSHWLATDKEIPALLAYAWTADPNTLKNYRMELD